MGVLLLREILDRQLLLTLILINQTKIGEGSDLDAEGKTRWDQASLSNENLLYEAQVKTG